MLATILDATTIGLISDDPALTGKFLELIRDDPKYGSRDGGAGSPVETSETFMNGDVAKFRIIATTPGKAATDAIDVAVVLVRVEERLYDRNPTDEAFEGRAAIAAVAAAGIPYALVAVYSSRMISVLDRYGCRLAAAGLPEPAEAVEIFPDDARAGRPVGRLFSILVDLGMAAHRRE